MHAQDLMTRDPKTIRSEDTVADAIRVMKEEDCGIVPIVDGNGQGRVVGVVTDRDFALALGERDEKPSAIRARDVMSTEIVSVEPDADIGEVERRMQSSRVRRLLVCENGRLLGVIATADLAREARTKEVGRVVEKISQA